MSDSVVVQDQRMEKTTGIGYESQGLYHMLKSPQPVVFTSTTSTGFLHNLVHPSLAKRQKLIPSFSTWSSFEWSLVNLGNIVTLRFPKKVNNKDIYMFDIVQLHKALFLLFQI